MRFIVIGCGRTGAGLARRLAAGGNDVAVVDTDVGAFERLPSGFDGDTVLGVGFDRDVLTRAGIAGADGLAAVTGDDEVNAVVARLAARIFHVPKVVARLHDPLKAEIYRRLGVQVVAPVDWSIHRTADLLTFAQGSVVVDDATNVRPARVMATGSTSPVMVTSAAVLPSSSGGASASTTSTCP
ncbi:MAG: potassium channel family protein, partial [Acidimicrobiia bacterium]